MRMICQNSPLEWQFWTQTFIACLLSFFFKAINPVSTEVSKYFRTILLLYESRTETFSICGMLVFFPLLSSSYIYKQNCKFMGNHVRSAAPTTPAAWILLPWGVLFKWSWSHSRADWAGLTWQVGAGVGKEHSRVTAKCLLALTGLQF